MIRVAVIGGGPGGLFTALQLEELFGEEVDITLFEADSRVGGKIRTERFDDDGPLYEGGVAELYDYSVHAVDPLKQLIAELGLETIPMSGPAVIMGGTVIHDLDDLEAKLGLKAARAVGDFYQECEQLCTPSTYYDNHFGDDNAHPWADVSFDEILARVDDVRARAYIETAIHSDVAAEPHQTNGLNGLKNVVMEDPRYLSVYTVRGGIEEMVRQLAAELRAKIRLNHRVTEIARHGDGAGYRLLAETADGPVVHHTDYVIVALPHSALPSIRWPDADLAQSLASHIAHYDYPAHYLRVVCRFRKPFWREVVGGDYFMANVLGGTCFYDEGVRYPSSDGTAVLNWLISGDAARDRDGRSDAEIIEEALSTLPPMLARGREHFLDARVRRWPFAISALPGGHPVQDTRIRHQPARASDPGLLIVGDYLYDCTLNGVFDSAGYAAGVLFSDVRRRQQLEEEEIDGNDAAAEGGYAVPDDYFEEYGEETTYSESFEEYFCENWTCDLIESVWGLSSGYKLLDCGSANGLTLPRFERRGVEAWGIENNRFIHSQTAASWKHRNMLGDVCAMPFPDNSFDIVYETCLCYLPPELVEKAIKEMFRVCRVGVICGSIATDMVKEIIEEEELLYGVRTFATTTEWAEHFQRNGFKLAISDPGILARIWDIEVKANEGYFNWYPDPDAMRCCFLSKPDVPVRVIGSRPQPRSLKAVRAVETCA
jgi:protoporphyrinogen oxidase/SAM-dependent methyltransferase